MTDLDKFETALFDNLSENGIDLTPIGRDVYKVMLSALNRYLCTAENVEVTVMDTIKVFDVFARRWSADRAKILEAHDRDIPAWIGDVFFVGSVAPIDITKARQ